MHKLKFIIAATFLILGAAIMLYLGNWQLDRLHWKSYIIAQLDKAYNNPNPPLFNAGALETAAQEGEEILFGSVIGFPIWEKEIFYGPKSKNREMGFNVITPVLLSSEGVKPDPQIAPQYILVNRGWISEIDAQDLEKMQRPEARLIFTGLIRKPDWNKYTPNNNPKSETWTKLDIAQIAKVKGLKNTMPYMLYAEKVSESVDTVAPLAERWYPRNKHKQYALFWFSMAGIFMGFFGFVFIKRRQSKTAN